MQSLKSLNLYRMNTSQYYSFFPEYIYIRLFFSTSVSTFFWDVLRTQMSRHMFICKCVCMNMCLHHAYEIHTIEWLGIYTSMYTRYHHITCQQKKDIITFLFLGKQWTTMVYFLKYSSCTVLKDKCDDQVDNFLWVIISTHYIRIESQKKVLYLIDQNETHKPNSPLSLSMGWSMLSPEGSYRYQHVWQKNNHTRK